MNPTETPIRWIRIRTVLLGLLVLGALAGLLARAAQLQLGEGARLARLAREQYRLEVSLPARRGAIVDRRGAALASSVQVDSVFVNPSLLPDPHAAALGLAAALHLDPHALERRLDPTSQFAWVKRQVTASEAEAARRLSLPGLGFAKEGRRFYPERELAAQLLGFTGLDGEGLEGLEKRYDASLRGRAVLLPGVRDAKGRVLTQESVSSGELEGAAIQLTLDRNIQYLAQQSLARQVSATRSASGMAIVMEPATGAILALAIAPSFNPNAVSDRDRRAVRDRAVADAFEPGSTFKAFLAAAALQERVVTPGTVLFGENGAFPIGGRTIHDHERFGWMSFAKVLQVSSNVGAAKVGLSLGRERLHDYLTAFGFGLRTEIGLPGEVRGQLPPIRSDIATATTSFGQGVTATPIQLVTGYAAIANGGTRMRPYVVARVTQPDGQVVETKPQVVRQVVSPAIAQEVTRMLEGVVEKGGTAEKAALPGYRVAGKTGTAQKVDPVTGGYSADKRFASFIGYLPAEAPRVVIGVFMDEPKGQVYGGLVAAPVFREIAEGTMRQLGIAPTEPLAVVARAPPAVASPPARLPAELIEDDESSPMASGRTVPAVVGLPARRAVHLLAEAGLVASLQGEGRVVGQRPAAGAALPADGTIALTLQGPAVAGAGTP